MGSTPIVVVLAYLSERSRHPVGIVATTETPKSSKNAQLSIRPKGQKVEV